MSPLDLLLIDTGTLKWPTYQEQSLFKFISALNIIKFRWENEDIGIQAYIFFSFVNYVLFSEFFCLFFVQK